MFHALNNDKETKVLFLDSLIRLHSPLQRSNISCRNREVISELEIDFLDRFAKSFLIRINPEKYYVQNIPELEIIDSVQ